MWCCEMACSSWTLALLVALADGSDKTCIQTSKDAVAGKAWKGKILVHTDNNMSQPLADMMHNLKNLKGHYGSEPGMMVQEVCDQPNENKE